MIIFGPSPVHTDMNTIAHIAAAVSVLWLSTEAFDRFSNGFIGFALLALFFLMLAMTVKAVQDDWGMFQERSGNSGNRRRRG